MKQILYKFLKGPAVATPSSEYRSALQQAEADQKAADIELADAQTAYRDSLTDPDERVSLKASERVTAALVRRDRSGALVEAISDRLAKAMDREAEAVRQERYDEAAKQAAAAKRAIAKEYPAAARRIFTLLRDLHLAEAAVAQANRELPTGAMALASPEQELRALASEPKQILSEKVVAAGWFTLAGDRIDPQYEKQIEQQDGQHFLPITTSMGRGRQPVERRHWLVREILPARGSYAPDRLSNSVALPGLRPGDSDIWAGVGFESDTDPAIVAQALAEMEAALDHNSGDPRGKRGVEAERKLLSVQEALERDAEMAVAHAPL